MKSLKTLILYCGLSAGLLLLITCDDSSNSELQGSEEAIDIDGNTYKTVTIGNQTWFAENLKTTKLNDRTDLEHLANDGEWGLSDDPAFSYYDNNSTNANNFGLLYNGHAIQSGKLCPDGWRVPH